MRRSNVSAAAVQFANAPSKAPTPITTTYRENFAQSCAVATIKGSVSLRTTRTYCVVLLNIWNFTPPVSLMRRDR